MRERVRDFRQSTCTMLRDHGAVLAFYGGAGLLMAHVGAFSTEAVPLAVRYAYFLALNLAAGAISVAIAKAIEGRAWLALRPAAGSLIRAVGVTLLLTPLIWIAAAWLLGGDPGPSRLPALAGQVAPVAALFMPLTIAIPGARRAPRGDARPASGTAVAVLHDLLPPPLRTAQIEAVAAEDHYLRVHTDRGAVLLTLRMIDALALLADADGARTHRSWWVARNAITGARRGGGRATLQLRNGLTVPVSRSYAPELRRRGWF